MAETWLDSVEGRVKALEDRVFGQADKDALYPKVMFSIHSLQWRYVLSNLHPFVLKKASFSTPPLSQMLWLCSTVTVKLKGLSLMGLVTAERCRCISLVTGACIVEWSLASQRLVL